MGVSGVRCVVFKVGDAQGEEGRNGRHDGGYAGTNGYESSESRHANFLRGQDSVPRRSVCT